MGLLRARKGAAGRGCRARSSGHLFPSRGSRGREGREEKPRMVLVSGDKPKAGLAFLRAVGGQQVLLAGQDACSHQGEGAMATQAMATGSLMEGMALS